MQVSQNILHRKYVGDVQNQYSIDMEHGSRNKYVPISIDDSALPQDMFVKSDYLKKIEELGDSLQDGFKSVENFMNMTNVLWGENILNNQDIIAANYIAKNSEDINFDSFNQILKNENLSMEMRGLINQLVNKLYNINYVNAGILVAS